MEIILLENILNLGNIGDKVKVKSGERFISITPSNKLSIDISLSSYFFL